MTLTLINNIWVYRVVLLATFTYNLEIKDALVGGTYLMIALIIPYLVMFVFNIATAAILLRKHFQKKKKLKCKLKPWKTKLLVFLYSCKFLVSSPANRYSVRTLRMRTEMQATFTVVLMIFVYTLCTLPIIIFTGLYVQRLGGQEFTRDGITLVR